jgi:hypothetical protein
MLLEFTQNRFLMRIITLVILLLFCQIKLSAQTYTIGVKITGLSIHPKGSYNAHLEKFKLDRKGVFVFNPGIAVSFEYFLYKDIFSIKFSQALYADCCAQFAGYTHVGFRHKLFDYEKHQLNGGLGPTFIYRRSWYKLDGYIDDFIFFHGGPEDNWQWKFIWYGGEVEYNYHINEETDLSLTIVPAIPALVDLNIGVRIKRY